MGSDSTIPISITPALDYLNDFYTSANGQQVTAADIVRLCTSVITDISSGNVSNTTQINNFITILADATIVNTNKIDYLHRLVGLLTLELVNQGFQIENEELLNELEKL